MELRCRSPRQLLRSFQRADGFPDPWPVFITRPRCSCRPQPVVYPHPSRPLFLPVEAVVVATYIARGREAATASSHVVLLAHDRVNRVPSSPSTGKPVSRVPSGRGAPRGRSHVPSARPCCRALSPASARSAAGRFVRESAFSGGKCWLSRACPCLEPRFPASTLCSKPSAGVEARLRVARSGQGAEMSCLPAVCVCNAVCVWRRAGSGLNFTLVSRNFSTLYQRSNSTTT